jgi:hypothetical protein
LNGLQSIWEASMKMPEPIATCFDDGYWIAAKTEAGRKFNDRRTSQLVYDKQALIDLLEAAAQKCDALYFNLNAGPDTCAQAIRSMKEKL